MTHMTFRDDKNECLKGLRDVICMSYFDHDLCYLNSFKEHIDHLKLLCKKLREHGIKLKAGKCQ